MKIILVFAALLTVTWAASTFNDTEDWKEYKAMFRKVYANEKEEERRMIAYIKTKQKVEKHNRKHAKGDISFMMEINKYADWFPEELKKLNGFKFNGRVRSMNRKNFEVPDGVKVPDEMNWVKKGAVTSVKNQGVCGSCYAFSAVGALEGLMFITNKTIIDLSAQELVDCTMNGGNYGCDGGFMDCCFKYVGDKRGISSMKSYPYIGSECSCRADRGKIRASCTDFVDLKETEEDLRKVVGTHAPVAIAFGVSIDFVFYKGGVFDGECSYEPNHAMLAVGYGKDKKTGLDYWLVKNSWGQRWGEKGYVKIIMGVGKCGIHEYNSYPVYIEERTRFQLNE